MSPASNNPLVLVVEDEVLVAVDLQAELEESGFRVAGPFTTCAAALTWLGTETPNVAVLDTVLRDGPCREVALALARRGVPFLIYSGHREDKQLLAEFHHVTWLEKPMPPSVLVDRCRQLLVPTEQV